MAGLRGSCSPSCDFRLLCGADRLHPSDYGGALSFLARAPSALVRMKARANMKEHKPFCFKVFKGRLLINYTSRLHYCTGQDPEELFLNDFM